MPTEIWSSQLRKKEEDGGMMEGSNSYDMGKKTPSPNSDSRLQWNASSDINRKRCFSHPFASRSLEVVLAHCCPIKGGRTVLM